MIDRGLRYRIVTKTAEDEHEEEAAAASRVVLADSPMVTGGRLPDAGILSCD